MFECVLWRSFFILQGLKGKESYPVQKVGLDFCLFSKFSGGANWPFEDEAIR